MIELRFRLDVYDKDAVQQAVDVFSPHGRIQATPQEEAILVRIEGTSEQQEREVSGELGNFVLGATVDGVQEGGL